MTDEEKEKYRGGLIATCKTYCHIDYDDDIEILGFDLPYDLDEDEQDGIENKVKDGTAKQVGGDVKPDKKNMAAGR